MRRIIRGDIRWVIGRWDGEEWWDQNFENCHPTHWHRLPGSRPLTEEQKREVDELIAKERRYQEDNAVEDDAESEVFGEPESGAVGHGLPNARQCSVRCRLRRRSAIGR